MEIGHHASRQWEVPRLPTFDADPSQAPGAVEVSHLKRRNRLASRPCIPQDEKDGDTTRALALLSRCDQRIHEVWYRHLSR